MTDLSPRAQEMLEEYRATTFTIYQEWPELDHETNMRRCRWNESLLWIMSATLKDLKKADIVTLLEIVQHQFRNLTLEEMKHAGLAAIPPHLLPTQPTSKSPSPDSATTTSETSATSPKPISQPFHPSQSTSWA